MELYAILVRQPPPQFHNSKKPAWDRVNIVFPNNNSNGMYLFYFIFCRFLDELSQRYRKQSEEMMNFLNRTVARLRNATKKTEETVIILYFLYLFIFSFIYFNKWMIFVWAVTFQFPGDRETWLISPDNLWTESI